MKKTLLSLIIMCFMAFTIVLSGCSPKGLTDNPATDANVVSNGGMTVVKGDYLYYVNGYIDETTLTKDDNKYGKVYNSGIYRTKLVNGEIVKDEEGFVTDTELVVSKIVGFSNGGFYIIDDYIYYTTPYMNLDRDGNLQNDRVEFHRININGTDDKTLYTTSENVDKLDWSVYKINGTVYISTYVGTSLIVVNTDTKKTTAEIADVTSYAFLKETNYKTGTAKNKELHNYIYYTRAITEEDNVSIDHVGNMVCKVNIATGEIAKVDVSNSKNYTYTIKYANPNNIYYNKKDSRIESSLDLLYKKSLTVDTGVEIENIAFSSAMEEKVSNVAYSEYFFCDFGDNLVIANNDNGTFLVESGVSKQVLSSKAAILNVYDGYAYYAENNVLKRFNIRNAELDSIETVTDEEKTHTITNSNFIDFDNQRVYVYCDYTSANGSTNKYLNYIEDDLTQRFVGEFEEEDLPTKPEQDEESEEYIPHID